MSKLQFLLPVPFVLLSTVVSPAQVSPDEGYAPPTVSLMAAYDLQAPRFDKVESARARAKLRGAWKVYRSAIKTFERAGELRSLTKRPRAYRSAGDALTRVTRRLDALRKAYHRDAVLVAETGRLAQASRSLGSKAYLEYASDMTSRGSYRGALEAVENARRLTPRSAAVRSLLRHIQLVQASASRRGF